MPKFGVSWTEYHYWIVEAKNREEAYNKIHNGDCDYPPNGETLVDQETTGIMEVKEEPNRSPIGNWFLA
jgi:hypothetical protein